MLELYFDAAETGKRWRRGIDDEGGLKECSGVFFPSSPSSAGCRPVGLTLGRNGGSSSASNAGKGGWKEGSGSAPPLGPNGDEADVHHTGSGGSGDAQLCVGPVGHRRFGQPFVGGRRPRCGRSIGVKAAPPLASLRLTFFAKLNKRKRSSSLLEGAGQLKQPWASQRETLEMPCENDSMTDSKMWI